MTYKTKYAFNNFEKISVNRFIKEYKTINPKADINSLKESLLHFRHLKAKGEKCRCGNPVWAIGSAISGRGCFTCITGEADCSNDYEIF
jgi:hypothetical protein